MLLVLLIMRRLTDDARAVCLRELGRWLRVYGCKYVVAYTRNSAAVAVAVHTWFSLVKRNSERAPSTP